MGDFLSVKMAGYPEEDKVKGGQVAMEQAAKGMALFEKQGDDQVTFDTAGAEAFKAEHEAAIEKKKEEETGLTGKDNKKARREVGKEISAMKLDKKYIDALKVCKGLPPPNGNFAEVVKAKKLEEVTEAAADDAVVSKSDAKKEAKPPKKTESAGISPAERKELEDLKTAIIKKKTELKEQGLSGGQCNKDPEVVTMVARMQELKIKEDPSLATEEGKDKKEKKGKKLSAESEAEKAKLEKELEEYRQKLVTEFKYSKKEINADPDFIEMSAKLK